MNHRKAPWAALALALAAPGFAGTPWINELHYDDTGSDTGEFVEIAVPSSFTDLASVSLTLYNGGDGRQYASHALGTFQLGDTVDGTSFYSKLISGIQNGTPDGLALTWSGGSQFVSYEGSFLAANGPASGLSSTDIGISQPDTGAPEGTSLGLTGSGHRYEDFVWSSISSATPGGANVGQTVVPEPGTYAIFASGALGMMALLRRRVGRSHRHAT